LSLISNQESGFLIYSHNKVAGNSVKLKSMRTNREKSELGCDFFDILVIEQGRIYENQ
jgi:hypothetical protein